MKALVYHGPGNKSLDERPIPEIAAPTDAIVRITSSRLEHRHAGTDLVDDANAFMTQDHEDDDLRYGLAHSQRRRANLHGRADPRS